MHFEPDQGRVASSRKTRLQVEVEVGVEDGVGDGVEGIGNRLIFAANYRNYCKFTN